MLVWAALSFEKYFDATSILMLKKTLIFLRKDYYQHLVNRADIVFQHDKWVS